MKIAEKILWSVILITAMLHLFLIPFTGVILILSLGALSVIYMFGSIPLFNNITLRNVFNQEFFKDISTGKIIGSLCLGMTLSIIAIGILFKLMIWPGGMNNLVVGLVCLGIIIVIAFIRYSSGKSIYYIDVFKRSAFIVIIAVPFLFISENLIMEFKYRNHPAYLQAWKKYKADPSNPKLREQLNLERMKMVVEK
jgi:glucan phosphoethanolaminetransferase (alkaline phosphatase superfamily)